MPAAQNPAYRPVRHKLSCFHCSRLGVVGDCAQIMPEVFSKPSPFSMNRLARSRSSFTNGALCFSIVLTVSPSSLATSYGLAPRASVSTAKVSRENDVGARSAAQPVGRELHALVDALWGERLIRSRMQQHPIPGDSAVGDRVRLREGIT